MPITTLEPTPSHKRLRLFALIAAILAFVQLAVAIAFMVSDVEALSKAHEGIAFLVVVATVLAAFPAWVWGRLSKDTGLFPHAAGVAGAAVVQLIIGFVFAPKEGAPYGTMMYVHFALGILIALGALFLYTKARKMPIIVTAANTGQGTPRPE